jgi:hypothetical protein
VLFKRDMLQIWSHMTFQVLLKCLVLFRGFLFTGFTVCSLCQLYVQIWQKFLGAGKVYRCQIVPSSARAKECWTVHTFVIFVLQIQGGDPTGTGRGGESAWGEAFRDELKPNLTHAGRGVLSMANSGPNTNKSQLYVHNCFYYFNFILNFSC